MSINKTLMVLAHTVWPPIRDHRSAEFSRRIFEFARFYKNILVVSFEKGSGFSMQMKRDPDFKQILVIRIKGNFLRRQIAFCFLMKKIVPDVIFADTDNDAINAFIFSKTSGRKIAIFVQGYLSELILEAFKQRFGNRSLFIILESCLNFLEKTLYSIASKIICISKDLREKVRRRMGFKATSQVYYVPHSISYVSEIPSTSIKNSKNFLKNLEISLGHKIVPLISMSRLVPSKRIDIAIKTMLFLKKLIPEAILLVVGKGFQQNYLKTLIKNLDLEDRVFFLGHLPRDEALALLSLSSTMIFPTQSEGVGLVMLESFALGVPVVAHAFNAALVNDIPSAAFLITSKNPRDYAKAIWRVINDKNLRERMITNGHALASIHLKFSEIQRIEKIVQLLAEAS